MPKTSPSKLELLREASARCAEARVAGFFSSAKCMAHLKAETDAHRPPLLVLGSGLLAQTGYHSVSSWTGLLERLLETVAPNEAPIPRHLIALSPTTTWELIVQRLARSGKVRAAASDKPELAAQRALAALVRSGLQRDRSTSSDKIAPGIPVKSLLSSRLAGVVSLNFTPEPFATALQSARLGAKKERSRKVRGCEGLEVFFPHGDIESPASLALGLRKYAERVKRWEDLRQLACEAERASSSRRRPLPMSERTTFIHHTLTSPTIFAGCGLSEVESTLWWLLATRARNCARSVPLSTPLGYFLTADPLSLSLQTKLEFTRCKPIHFPEHTDVWRFVADLIDSLPDWRGDGRAQERTQSVPANARKASRETGRIRSGTFWTAVRTAGLDRSAHDLSAVPDAEREVALAAALRVTMAPGGRSRSQRATNLKPRPTGSQLVVVHCKGTKFIIEEVREASLDDFVRFARNRLADYASSDYVLILVSKAIQSARGADQAPRLAAIIEECNLKHAMPCSPDRLLELLRGIADVSARRPQENSPDSRADARARLRMFIHRNSPDTLGQAQIRRLNGYLDQVGWLDLGVDSEGPVPADVWDEIRLRLDDVRAGSNARSFLISQLQQLGSGLT